MRIICAISLHLIFLTGQAQHNIHCKATYAVDSLSTWKLDSLVGKSFKGFGANENVSIGYNLNSAIWCLFTLENRDSLPVSTWLSFPNIHLDSIQVFNNPHVLLLGSRTGFRSPYLSAQTFEIQLQPHEQRIIHVRIKKGISILDFSFELDDEQILEARTLNIATLISFFNGIVFLLVLINFGLFVITQKRLYLHYILYSLLTCCYILVNSGFAKYSLLPDFLHFSKARIYISSLWFISLSFFLADFLQLAKTQKLKYRLILFFSVINLAIIGITMLLLVYHRYHSLQFFLSFGVINFGIVTLIIVWASLVHIKISWVNGSYVLLAFMPHLVWAMALVLKNLQMVSTSIPVIGLVFLSVYEVFLFGFVLMKNYIETFRANTKLTRQIVKDKEKSLVAISEAQIRERRQIANLIHDSFGSKIAHILHLIELNNNKLAHEEIRELTHEIRDASHRIMPKALDEGALSSSLNTQIENLNRGRLGCKIDLTLYDFPEILNTPWVLNMYLISLELINNALRHADARSIQLEFFGYEDVFVFQYTDDGIGFDLSTTSKGFGLSTIESRVVGFNGNFEINSAIGEGTVVQISIPRK